MTPDEIINQARQEDPSFDAKRHPRKVAIDFLSRLQRRLVAEWAKLEEAGFVEVFVVTFPLDDFAAGAPLLEAVAESGESVPDPLAVTAWHRPLSIIWQGREDDPQDLDLIRWGDRQRKKAIRAAWIRENRVFFTGRAEDWTDVLRVELTYTPTPADIAAATEELLLPITAENALVMHVAAFFARRSKTDELARSRREYIVEANDAEALWLSEIEAKEGAIISRTRSVW